MQVFEKALRNKFRFSSKKGLLTTEDLWSLSLQELDQIAIAVNREVKVSEEESFILSKSNTSRTEQEKLDVLKYIIKVKMEEEDIREKKRIARQKREEILAIISRKERTDLESKSLEELRKQLEELEG